jgi:hypothetical protein
LKRDEPKCANIAEQDAAAAAVDTIDPNDSDETIAALVADYLLTCIRHRPTA